MSDRESLLTRSIDLASINKLAIQAGIKIMEIYGYEDFSSITQLKADESPLTLADHESDEIITRGLQSMYPQIPILSEEGKHTAYEIRKDWQAFWLVDPLDGTKEFIKRNGAFTVNIALIVDKQPVMGVIYAPVLQTLYNGMVGTGAFKQQETNAPEAIQVNRKKNQLIAVGSRSHADPAEQEVLKPFDVVETISIGSSLKFCLIAEGKADIYYRHGPTMEWDTAAGQAIVTAAGGKVLDASGEIFTYNKLSLVNGSFLCQGF
jgi:3'(2'), 5'-bisphosphate nucleotidase